MSTVKKQPVVNGDRPSLMKAVDRVGDIGEVIGALAVVILMIGVFLAAIWKAFLGVVKLFSSETPAGLVDVLKGIEYFFLAPLLLLSYVSMVLYVRGHFQAVKPVNDITEAADRNYRNPNANMAHEIKLSVASLVIASLLIDMLGKAISNGVTDALNLAAECLAVVLSLGYLLIIRGTHRDV